MSMSVNDVIAFLRDYARIGQSLAAISADLTAIRADLGVIMTEQQNVDQDVAALGAALQGVSDRTAQVVTDQAAIAAEIQQLQQQVANGQTVDLSALDTLAQSAAATAGQLGTAVDSLTGLVPAPPAG